MFSWYQRRLVPVGGCPIGGDHPIRVQTMTNSRTLDTQATVGQIAGCVAAGAEIVRLATPSVKDAENLSAIRQALIQQSIMVPLVADVHFNPKVALLAAGLVEKVRINPGNYVGAYPGNPSSTSGNREATDRIRQNLKPLFEKCKAHGTALRIGTNHGSLSDRIVQLFGNGPLAMVEATLEFLRICREEEFFQVVVSLKASQARIMVAANRLLFHRMGLEGFHYPLHLGVTEAGHGLEGRIKSCVGMGSLLADGIGDTLRVSLTEPPEQELPVARNLASAFFPPDWKQNWDDWNQVSSDPFFLKRHESAPFAGMGGNSPVALIVSGTGKAIGPFPDYFIPPDPPQTTFHASHLLSPEGKPLAPIFSIPGNLSPDIQEGNAILRIGVSQEKEVILQILSQVKPGLLILEAGSVSPGHLRRLISEIRNLGYSFPLILELQGEGLISEENERNLGLAGAYLIDGLFQGLFLSERKPGNTDKLIETGYSILQACGLRQTRAEIISCPSCGRTDFDILRVAREVQEATGHLKGLTIAVMGCIVNGPGEMADADYGYIGSGKGRVNLYYRRKLAETAIPEVQAIPRLIRLIKDHGDWVEK